MPVKDTNGMEVSSKCDHVEYPNHPMRAHRKVCGAELASESGSVIQICSP